MSEAHTIQALADHHAKLFLKKKPECGYNLLDLQFLANFAVLKWENPEHQKTLRHDDHVGMETLFGLFSRNPPVACDWIKQIHKEWMSLPEQKKELIRRKKGVREIQDNTAEHEIHYDERYLRLLKAEYKKAEADLDNIVTSKRLPSEEGGKAP
jgi:hypothetical protein